MKNGTWTDEKGREHPIPPPGVEADDDSGYRGWVEKYGRLTNATKVGDLGDIYLTDPIVHNCLSLWRRGDTDLETALVTCIIAMNERHEKENEMLIDLINRYPTPMLIHFQKDKK